MADELFLLCRPERGTADVARQAETVYEAMLDLLRSQGVGPEALASETVFFRSIRHDVDSVLEGRRRVLGRDEPLGCRPAVTVIGQPPLRDEADVELSAVAVIPRRHQPWSSSEVRRTPSCSCEACSPGARAKVVRTGDQTCFHAGNIYGSGRGAVEEAYDMFRVAEELLRKGGMEFGDVVRTWIYLRDIDRDYAALNQARRRFFEQHGIERRPASTGVQGIPFPDAHDFSMSLYAVKSTRPLDVTVMSTSTLSEAWTYGADFSRGLRLVDGNKTALYVSGTASVDEVGQTVHVGDFEAQVDRMLHNIASLLSPQGATFENVVSAVTYLKRPADAPVLRAMYRDRGFEGFPCALVEAPLCRPELLCEAEAVAALPISRPGA